MARRKKPALAIEIGSHELLEHCQHEVIALIEKMKTFPENTEDATSSTSASETKRLTKPTDEEILKAVNALRRNGQPTYLIRNVLADSYKGIKTAFVRRRLEALERLGKVKRVPGAYATQITWALA